MPLYVFIGRDSKVGPALRKTHRPAHLERLETLAAAGKIPHAGPLLGENGDPIGSLILFEADDLPSARRFAAADPYVVSGVFASHEVYETKVVLPK